jgi:aminoglycoside phosphotransferase (APT) family kinase protein
VIGDIDIARVSSSWFSMVETLAKLHSYDPDAIGLGTYGKGKDFYLRHTNTFSRIEAQQAKVKDKDTGKELGRAHENYDEMMSFVRKNVPGERKAIVHGDFKFDNVVST